MLKEKRIKKRMVVIGGGSGTFNLLNSFKNYFTDLSAIVTMMDSGGSTGILREDFGILPPGDVRRALVALASSDNKILSELFSYRFEKGRGLAGHSFGNLFITALEQITGDFETALDEAGKILNADGQVVPVTRTKAHLVAELENGKKIFGETNIDIPKHNGNLKIVGLTTKPKAEISASAKEIIKRADLIVIGPGDLYTSVLANVVVGGVKEALMKTKAKVVFVANVMTKFGETNHFTAEDFISEFKKYAGEKTADYFAVNSRKPSRKRLLKYAEKNAEFVEPNVKAKDKQMLMANLIRDKEYIRHDGDKLAKLLIKRVLKK
ncbi:MAG: hypothetical protein COU10_02980 [Candidatus Harrisonbacteria bacterium CG10_big_fil_rev_8_21_14_0_10_45_28]|uniref:Putative gluconeogenesis factor n=1 Tax=Candidatus Harrisonbacteria bacterium CG10_big_fil_rev_8_21_14_0_10_45_28 TaxID=1974586 RepID=A0A2H0UMZ1_9BACT|nr:MAG: hypothetical protein COU10_02980 [Candidatus Harrisonbacteria bacterium CG10_big_fil_rev_8_21_14_0_10_45_28]